MLSIENTQFPPDRLKDGGIIGNLSQLLFAGMNSWLLGMIPVALMEVDNPTRSDKHENTVDTEELFVSSPAPNTDVIDAP